MGPHRSAPRACSKLGSPGEPRFRRSDANADGKVDIGDPIAALAYLFLGALVPGCLDAVDANDDGVLNITDPVFTLGYLFLGESEIPAPGARVCGPDPSAEGLTRCAYEPAEC